MKTNIFFECHSSFTHSFITSVFIIFVSLNACLHSSIPKSHHSRCVHSVIHQSAHSSAHIRIPKPYIYYILSLLPTSLCPHLQFCLPFTTSHLESTGIISNYMYRVCTVYLSQCHFIPSSSPTAPRDLRPFLKSSADFFLPPPLRVTALLRVNTVQSKHIAQATCALALKKQHFTSSD